MARRLVSAVAVLAMLSQVASAEFAQGQAAAGSGSGAAGAVSARVDRLFAQWDTPDTAGCSLGVSRDGAVVYERGYGMANLDLGVPITPASVFHVASVSKQFTAMAIVLLAERGRLSLDDEVRKYITELPMYGTPLTLRHLLSHTGGLRDEFLLRELTAPRDDDGDPNGALVKLLAHQRGLNFAPGTEYQYSNAGYTLLGTIAAGPPTRAAHRSRSAAGLSRRHEAGEPPYFSTTLKQSAGIFGFNLYFSILVSSDS